MFDTPIQTLVKYQKVLQGSLDHTIKNEQRIIAQGNHTKASLESLRAEIQAAISDYDNCITLIQSAKK